MDQEAPAAEALNVEPAAVTSHAPVVRGIRRLLVTVVVVSFICGVLLTASKSGCFEATGTCYYLRMSASPLLFFGFAVIVLVALGRIINRDLDAVAATPVLRRAGYAVMIVGAVAVVASYAWFSAMPLGGSGRYGSSVISPFPFALIESTIPAAG